MRILVAWAIILTLLSLSSAQNGYKDEHLSNSLQEFNRNERPKTRGIFDNYIDKTLRKVFDKVKRIVADKEPYSVPPLPSQKIVDDNTEFTISLSDVKERKASQVYVNRMNSNMFFLTEQFDVTFPELELEGIYNVLGTISGKSVNGNGNFKAWITNIRSWGTAYGYYSQGSILIKDVTFDYIIDNIKAETDGLEVEGLSREEVTAALNKGLVHFFGDHERVISEKIARALQDQMNEFLNGKSVPQLISWITRFISG